MQYVSVAEASKLTGICSQTLRKLSDQNKIKSYKTVSGHRKFDISSLQKMCTNVPATPEVQEDTRKNYIYARISSKKQADDLNRQVDFIRSYKPEYSSYILVTDIASGINFGRKGLSTLLEQCLQRDVGEIVIAHKDRLSRFGFDLINLVVTKAGGRITVIDDQQNKSTEQELSEDLLSIVNIYCCKQQRKRSYKGRKATKVIKDQNEAKSKPEESNQ